jgi:oligosaccharide repeat unit polymerase
LMSSLALLAFASGQLVTNLVHQRTKSAEVGMSPATVSNDLTGDRLFIWHLFAFAGALGALFYLYEGVQATGGLVFLQSFKGFSSVLSLAEDRLSFAQSTTGYLYELYGVVLPLSGTAFLLRFTKKHDKRHRNLALLLLGLAAAALTAAGYRTELMLFCVMVFVPLSYFYGTGFNRTLGVILIGAFILFVVVSAGIYSNQVGPSLSTSIIDRIFLIQALGPQFVFQAYPAHESFTGGSTLVGDLSGILPGHQTGYSSLLPSLRGVKSLNNPTGSTADLYLNFGPIGMMLGMFFLGALCQLIHASLSVGRTITRLALSAGATAALAYGALAGIAGVILQFGILTVALMGAGIWLFGNTPGTTSSARTHRALS